MQNKIKSRKTTRAFSDVELSEIVTSDIRKLLLKPNACLFGTAFSPRLMQSDFLYRRRLGRVVSYGGFSGKPTCIFSPVAREKYAMIDYGYCMEKLVLEMTGKGLDTMWTTTVFKDRQLKKIFQLKDGRDVPALVAVGHRKEKKTMAKTIGDRQFERKPFEVIFYNKSLNYPLKREEAGPYLDALEHFRLAPSYNNLQRWVVVKEGHKFHFYSHGRKENTMVYIDMGAALQHFDAIRKSQGLEGDYEVLDCYKMPDYDYIVTYIARP